MSHKIRDEIVGFAAAWTAQNYDIKSRKHRKERNAIIRFCRDLYQNWDLVVSADEGKAGPVADRKNVSRLLDERGNPIEGGDACS